MLLCHELYFDSKSYLISIERKTDKLGRRFNELRKSVDYGGYILAISNKQNIL